MRQRQSGHVVLIVGVVIIALVILGLLGWVFWKNFSTSNGSSVANFEQCKSAVGSKILETFPEQCVTSEGRSFTGPTKNGVTSVSYCTDVEKLCFSYPSDWKITQGSRDVIDPDAKSDSLEVVSPSGDLTLTLITAIGGIGGYCDLDTMGVDVKVLTSSPIPTLTGYKTDFSMDMLHVARIVYGDGEEMEGNYVAGIYVTDEESYTIPGTLRACGGSGFSGVVAGKNSRLAPDTNEAGGMRFGYEGFNGSRFASQKDATDAFDNDSYKQALAILTSLHYK